MGATSSASWACASSPRCRRSGKARRVNRFAAPSPRAVLEWAVPGLLGIAAMGAVLVGLSQRGPVVPAAGIALIPIVAATILRPRLGVLLLILSMGYMEEFRGGIGDSH